MDLRELRFLKTHARNKTRKIETRFLLTIRGTSGHSESNVSLLYCLTLSEAGAHGMAIESESS